MTTTARGHSYLLDDVGDGVRICGPRQQPAVFVAPDEPPAVQRAVRDLSRDLTAVTGATATTTERADAATIVIGTIGTPEIDRIVQSRGIDTSALRDDTGAPRWEAFLVATDDDRLYLIGADRRGTVYAVYDFAEAIGVSPWYWWGDVTVRRRESIVVARNASFADWPSVQYRGVFLNDEEELDAWAREHTPDGGIGPATYERVFELILRLKGNYLWPAMHAGAFNHDPENGRLADEMGIVIGTSHCDMLLRSNEHEFRPWAESQAEPVEYDYSLPGRNRELLREYWRGSIEQNRRYEVTWTVGMRGIHDYGFQTTAIDDDPALTDAERFDAKVRLLETAIADQRALLADTLETDCTTVPQVFIPYKEVLPLYEAGLQVPDDVTLVWTNDNFGYVRRFPSEAELQRSGGHGLYYHSSYWSDFAKSYLATSSTPLALMQSELEKAWDRGIRRLWVDNIGGLKPLEQETEFFLRSAWEAGRTSTTADVAAFTAEWIDEKFPGAHGAEAAAIYHRYYQLNNQRKHEHLVSDAFAQVGYGDEAGRRVGELRELYERTNAILQALPAGDRDAFFELFGVKVHTAYLAAAQFYHADRSTLAHAQGKLAAADRHVALARAFEAHKRTLIHFYNREMSRGRWGGMFTPEAFPPPVMPMHPAATPALRIDDVAGLGVVVWGDAAPGAGCGLTFFAHGVRVQWLEVFTTGARGVEFVIEADPWIEVSHAAGMTDTETRVFVRVADDALAEARSGTVTITSPTTGERVVVAVTTVPAPADGLGLDGLGLAGIGFGGIGFDGIGFDGLGFDGLGFDGLGFDGLVEADGYVSIDPSRPDAATDGTRSRWRALAHLGQYGNAAMQASTQSHAVDPASEASAALEYEILLRTAGSHRLDIHRHPTLNATGRVRLGISVDDHPVSIVESPTTDEHRGRWNDGVLENIEILTLTLPELEAGRHRLRVHVVDEFVTISKLVVHTGAPRDSRLGPPFTARRGETADERSDGDPAAFDLAALDAVAHAVYRADPAEVPLLDQAYAGPGFWDGDTTFRPCTTVRQIELGAPRLGPRAGGGGKDLVRAIGSGVVRETSGVIAFEAENALAGDDASWLTSTSDGLAWHHTQAETDGATGLAMHVRPRGLRWDDPSEAPGLHYRLEVTRPGVYRAWFLVKFDDGTDDSFHLAVDDVVLAADELHHGGDLATYGDRQVWLWALVATVELSAGPHTLSILARESGLRVDRVYLTTGGELPPTDAHWVPSPRSGGAQDPVPRTGALTGSQLP